jgi:hypothetical protein
MLPTRDITVDTKYRMIATIANFSRLFISFSSEQSLYERS